MQIISAFAKPPKLADGRECPWAQTDRSYGFLVTQTFRFVTICVAVQQAGAEQATALAPPFGAIRDDLAPERGTASIECSCAPVTLFHERNRTVGLESLRTEDPLPGAPASGYRYGARTGIARLRHGLSQAVFLRCEWPLHA